MKVTRVIVAAAAAAAACAAASPKREPAALVVRAPDLAHPVTEPYPGASRPKDPVKTAVLERINADRKEAGLSPVAWDEAAARVADAFCAAQVREGTTGHFLEDGLPPYARTGLAGIFGMEAENVTTWKTTGATFSKSTRDLALSGHKDMMSETPPQDGHRRTILDPDATHVGVGWAQERGNFRMDQEFLTRRLAELTLQKVADLPNTILFKGRTLAPYRLDFVTLALEPAPRPLTKSQASSRTSYTYPVPRLGYVPEGKKSLRIVGTETEDRIRVGAAGDFTFRFTPPLSGLWTILFYTNDGKGEARPGGLAVLWVAPGEAAR
jgi:uncharacterized protein YkwD